MATKLTHPYFGVLDTSTLECEEGEYQPLWEQELPYKGNIVLVDFWFEKDQPISKSRLDAFEAFLKDLSQKEAQAREAIRQYLKENPDEFDYFKEKNDEVPDDIDTFVDELEMDMLDLWYPQDPGEPDVNLYFSSLNQNDELWADDDFLEDDIFDEEGLSVSFTLSGKILSVEWE